MSAYRPDPEVPDTKPPRLWAAKPVARRLAYAGLVLGGCLWWPALLWLSLPPGCTTKTELPWYVATLMCMQLLHPIGVGVTRMEIGGSGHMTWLKAAWWETFVLARMLRSVGTWLAVGKDPWSGK